MSGQRTGRRLLAAFGGAALLVACTPLASEPPKRPVGSEDPVATSFAPATQAPSAAPPVRQRTSGLRAPPARPSARGDTAGLRLPVASDLGPNYFEVLAAAADVRPDEGPTCGVSATVVGFGFSERAKLPDERIELGGPLAAVARKTEHPSTESATKFATAASVAESLALPDSSSAASALGLTAALAASPPTSHDLASDLTGTRTIRTGWLTGPDGTRMATTLETWTVTRSRTVLTVVLVWGSQPNNGWGERLLARLAQTEAKLRATRAA